MLITIPITQSTSFPWLSYIFDRNQPPFSVIQFYIENFRFGILLMVFGEIGNFSAYGFAPASLVAPLGTTTVIGKQQNLGLIISAAVSVEL